PIEIRDSRAPDAPPRTPDCQISPSARFPARGRAPRRCRMSGELDVVQYGVGLPAHLVLDEPAAGRTAELAELDGVLDEALGIADQRTRRLDRPIDAMAVVLVVLARRAERLTAARATEPPRAAVVHEIEVVRDLAQDGQARAHVRARLVPESLGE